ncbi:hypothetical protein [Ancylomarina longa]|uniref:HTH domain-containing protein n=1 Tax=Ancylomarina longa TaxID=2487017 RepID=A0A434AWH2_9BACT|nr:hypothetical protein [Ancylomarina longa]RUT78849.1 hypothetical protein DLK05_06880 [Ancylomarina longa]
MKITDNKEILSRTKELIEHHATGTPSQLALKLGVSERNAYRILEYLKGSGWEIHYSRMQESYVLND